MTLPNFSSVLQRIAEKDKSAVDECLDKYGGIVWALSKKYTDSEAEAEAAAEKIFDDIWYCADCFDSEKNLEKDFILYIILKNLFGHLLLSENDNLHKIQTQQVKQKLTSEEIGGLQTYLYLRKFMTSRSHQL